MIQNYSIKYENNEEVLYLYLNYDYEFGSFNKGNSFFTQLKDFLNNKIINFKGRKIVLVVSGIIIGTILLNNNYYKPYKIDNSNNNNINYVNQVVLNDFNNQPEFIINVDEEDKLNDEIIVNEDNNIKNNEISYFNTNTSTISEDINNNQISANDIINDNIQNNEEKYNTIENNKIMVTLYRSNGEILNIELEEYLIGVVAGEMPASFNIEALKVQAVIARTYTLKSLQRGKLLTDTVSTQVYIDNNQMKTKWGADYNKYYNKIKEAVNSTEGLYITYNGDYIDAVYFSTSNGYTEDSKYVWGNSIPYLKSVESTWDINASSYLRTTTVSFQEASNILGFNIDQNVSIYNILRNESNRITSITINDKTYTGIEIRNLFNLRSADFDINIKEDGLEFTTYGYGHGVGVSQYGANGMANNGYNYNDIINYYYKNVNIEKIPH